MAKCVNCDGRRVGKANANGFAKCPDCGCTNIIPRPEDYAAAAKFKSIIGSEVRSMMRDVMEKD